MSQSVSVGTADIVIVGRGALGRSLAGALDARLVPGRDPLGLEALRPAGGAAALVLLAVPDSALHAVATRLAALPPAPRTAFAHLSGALPLEALAPLSKAGFRVGSLHPLQTFPGERPADAFRGISFAVDASEDAVLSRLEGVAFALGGTPRRVRDAERPLYHAAAVLASNDLVALAARACSVLGLLGWTVEEALAGLLPLMRGALESLEQRGLPGALSGPIRRADVVTVRRHLRALAEAGELPALDTYRVLGLSALDLARELGLEPGRASDLERLLAGAAS